MHKLRLCTSGSALPAWAPAHLPGCASSRRQSSATGFQKVMSLGQTPHSHALCTPMIGKGAAPAAPAARCNTLRITGDRC
ncbi:MAG: hypothetical protein C0470_16505 [Verminephrobacter sp.]|nr:hypothetical protein [Verminephrobacter sp.]